MNREALGALLQLNAEKNIPREQLVASLAEAIESAYRRATPGNENVYVEFDEPTGGFKAYRGMVVVDEVLDPQTEWAVDEAQKTKPDAKVGELIKLQDIDTNQMGRVHAQIAQQLFRQRLREVEREQVFGQYAQRESEIITGTVSRVEPRGVILDVGRAEAVLPVTDQSASEHYRIGQHVKAYVLEVRRTTKGPLIYVSRTHKNFLRRLFELEVPEIHGGTVEVKAIAREAGSRSKVAVFSRQEGLDPVGATVGQRGGRVQAVVAELGGEKIDIIPWHEDPAVFVANALSPAQVVRVDIDEENRIASVTVPERMLSLAIGREGQNARLAAKLTGWRIDIRSDQAPPRVAPAAASTESPAEELPTVETAAVVDDPAAEAEKPAKKKAPAKAKAAPKPKAEPKTKAAPKAKAEPKTKAATKPKAETTKAVAVKKPPAKKATAAKKAAK
ncbi:MAG: transcription termination/antitermination protein NusA [Chloroflexota bacterium]|jgi:N utilization substance protein A|nr:transcription termination/antitermination protein NusA [Chloroflexota bacterium]